MAAFLYFVEGQRAPINRERLEAWGLGYAFDGVSYHAELPGATPAGTKGVILSDDKRLAPYVVDFRPDEQTWIPFRGKRAEGSPPIWVGVYRDAIPTPDDLARDELVDGPLVEMADGKAWQIPRIRQVLPSGETHAAVPCYLAFDENGKPIRGQVVEKYRHLFERATPFFDAWYAEWTQTPDDDFSVRWDTLIDDAIFILGANYKVGLSEIELLRSWQIEEDDSCEQAGTVLFVACDCYNASRFLQKKNGARFATYRRWRSGLMPAGYAPTFADLAALARGI